MKKIVLSAVVLMAYSQLLWSQESSEVREPMSEFQKAIALYNRKMYQPAQNLFRKTQAEHPDKAVKAQSEYYIATIAALLNQEGADALVNNFILITPNRRLVRLPMYRWRIFTSSRATMPNRLSGIMLSTHFR